jgi:hypothetical protein
MSDNSLIKYDELLRNSNNSNIIIPSYMRNANSMIQTQKRLNVISWNIEGEKVFN